MPSGTATRSDYASLIQKVYRGSLAKTLLERSPAYSRLEALGKIRVDVRNEIRWPVVDESHGSASNISDGETLPASTMETYIDAVLYYKIFLKMIRVGRMMTGGSTNKNEFYSPDGDAIKHQVNRAIPQIARTIHSQIVALTTASTKNLTSLGDAIANTTNTYAGLSKATYTNWAPYLSSGGGTNRSLTETLLRDMYDTLSDDRESQISEVWCGITAWNALGALTKSFTANANPTEVHGGFTKIWWNDIPFYRMPGMDGNAMFFLNFDEGIEGEGIELLRQHEDDFMVREEATNSYDDRMSIAAHYQLVVHNPWKQGALLDVQ